MDNAGVSGPPSSPNSDTKVKPFYDSYKKKRLIKTAFVNGLKKPESILFAMERATKLEMYTTREN